MGYKQIQEKTRFLFCRNNLLRNLDHKNVIKNKLLSEKIGTAHHILF